MSANFSNLAIFHPIAIFVGYNRSLGRSVSFALKHYLPLEYFRNEMIRRMTDALTKSLINTTYLVETNGRHLENF